MLERKTVSQCISSDYCKGWNDAVDAMPKWISVEERLPDTSCRCLVMFEDGHCCDAEFDEDIDFDSKFGEWVGIYDMDTLGFVDSEWRGFQEVTHWMPLPAPKEEEVER